MKKLAAYQSLSALISPHCEFETDTISPEEWDELFAVANSQYLVPALYCALRDNSLLQRPPEMAVAYAHEIYSLNVERNRNLSKQLEKVVCCLNSVGVEPVLIKGAALFVEKWVPDPAARFMFDLDILVPNSQGKRALSTLLNDGYMVPDKYQQLQLEEGNHHYPPLQKKGEPALVELHIRPLSSNCRAVVTSTTLRHKAKKISLGAEANAWLPDPTEQLLLMFLHSEISHENHRFSLLDMRHAWDLPWYCRFYGDAVNWEEVEARVTVSGYQKELAGYLRLLNGFFCMPLPSILPDHASHAERHYRRVCRTLKVRRANLILIQQFIKSLQFHFSREMIEKRYGSEKVIRLQLNRIRYLLYLLGKFRKWSSLSKLVYSFRLRMRDNAGR